MVTADGHVTEPSQPRVTLVVHLAGGDVSRHLTIAKLAQVTDVMDAHEIDYTVHTRMGAYCPSCWRLAAFSPFVSCERCVEGAPAPLAVPGCVDCR
jgi:hypothetical protein